MFRPLLLGLLLSAPAFALTKPEWGGKVWGNHLRQSKDLLHSYTEQNAGGFLFAKSKLSESATINFEGLSYFVQTPLLIAPARDLKKGELFTELNELSLTYGTGSWNFKAGQMTTSWGKSDGLNPTDFLSGRRNLLLVPDDQLTRRGHGSAMIEYTPNGGSSAWSFQQWLVPLHSTSDVLLNQKLTQGLVDVQSNQRSGRIEYATKISYAGQGWDFDYTYFNGVNKSPVFTEASRTLMPFHLKLKPNYVHQEAHGINIAKDFQHYILRFEAAYLKRDQVLKNADSIKDPGRLDLVAGFEKSYFESHRLNIQAVANHYLTYDKMVSADPVTAQVQNLNRFVLAQHLQTRLGTLLVYYFEPSSLNQLKFKFSWLNYFHHESASFFTPQIDYLITENLQLQMYAMIFNGSRSSPFGVLKDLSSVALGATYQF